MAWGFHNLLTVSENIALNICIIVTTVCACKFPVLYERTQNHCSCRYKILRDGLHDGNSVILIYQNQCHYYYQTLDSLSESFHVYASVSRIWHITAYSEQKVQVVITPWEKYGVDYAIHNVTCTVNGIISPKMGRQRAVFYNTLYLELPTSCVHSTQFHWFWFGMEHMCR